MKRSKLKKHVAVEKCMSNTKRERRTRDDNSNNINMKGPHAFEVLLFLYCCY